VTYFLNLGTLHISGIAKARNFKFGMQIDHTVYYQTAAKLGQGGREWVT